MLIPYFLLPCLVLGSTPASLAERGATPTDRSNSLKFRTGLVVTTSTIHSCLRLQHRSRVVGYLRSTAKGNSLQQIFCHFVQVCGLFSLQLVAHPFLNLISLIHMLSRLLHGSGLCGSAVAAVATACPHLQKCWISTTSSSSSPPKPQEQPQLVSIGQGSILTTKQALLGSSCNLATAQTLQLVIACKAPLPALHHRNMSVLAVYCADS